MKVILPSEAEWEKAARGSDKILSPPVVIPLGKIQITHYISEPAQPKEKPQCRYPWGNASAANCANDSDTGTDATNAVGCFRLKYRPEIYFGAKSQKLPKPIGIQEFEIRLSGFKL